MKSGVEAALKETIYKSVQHEYIVRKIRQFPKVMVKKILRSFLYNLNCKGS